MTASRTRSVISTISSRSRERTVKVCIMAIISPSDFFIDSGLGELKA